MTVVADADTVQYLSVFLRVVEADIYQFHVIDEADIYLLVFFVVEDDM